MKSFPKSFKWKHELEVARRVLDGEPGDFVPAPDAYVAWRYIEPGVRLVFYPHTNKRTRNQHIRVRLEASPEKERAEMLIRRLREAGGYSSLFHKKLRVNQGER